MDWTGCELVEVIPGKVSGVPLIVGTRIPADVIVKNYEAGSPLEEIEENYPALTSGTITALLAYAAARRLHPPDEGPARRRPAAQASTSHSKS